MQFVNFRKFKWFTLIGSLINVALLIMIIVFMGNSITTLTTYAEANDNKLPQNMYVIYYVYYYLTYVAAVGIVFTLLSLSSSLRDDYLYHRFIWAYIVANVCSTAVIVTVVAFQLNDKYTYTYGLLSVNLPLMFSLLGGSILLPIVDIVRLTLKNAKNPFYSKKIKQNENFYAIQEDPQENEEVKNDDELANLSYYELYERRKKEIDELNNLYDTGKITLAEYNKKRNEIYKKYDKYN